MDKEVRVGNQQENKIHGSPIRPTTRGRRQDGNWSSRYLGERSRPRNRDTLYIEHKRTVIAANASKTEQKDGKGSKKLASVQKNQQQIDIGNGMHGDAMQIPALKNPTAGGKKSTRSAARKRKLTQEHENDGSTASNNDKKEKTGTPSNPKSVKKNRKDKRPTESQKKQLRLLVLGECQLQLPYLAKLCKERNLKFAKGGVKKKDYQEALWNYLQKNDSDRLWKMTVFDISQENKEANGRKARTDTPMKIPNPIMPDGPRILYSQKPAEYSPSTHKDLSDTSLLLPDISTSDNFATTPLGSVNSNESNKQRGSFVGPDKACKIRKVLMANEPPTTSTKRNVLSQKEMTRNSLQFKETLRQLLEMQSVQPVMNVINRTLVVKTMRAFSKLNDYTEIKNFLVQLDSHMTQYKDQRIDPKAKEFNLEQEKISFSLLPKEFETVDISLNSYHHQAFFSSEAYELRLMWYLLNEMRRHPSTFSFKAHLLHKDSVVTQHQAGTDRDNEPNILVRIGHCVCAGLTDEDSKRDEVFLVRRPEVRLLYGAVKYFMDHANYHGITKRCLEVCGHPGNGKSCACYEICRAINAVWVHLNYKTGDENKKPATTANIQLRHDEDTGLLLCLHDVPICDALIEELKVYYLVFMDGVTAMPAIEANDVNLSVVVRSGSGSSASTTTKSRINTDYFTLHSWDTDDYRQAIRWQELKRVLVRSSVDVVLEAMSENRDYDEQCALLSQQFEQDRLDFEKLMKLVLSDEKLLLKTLALKHDSGGGSARMVLNQTREQNRHDFEAACGRSKKSSACRPGVHTLFAHYRKQSFIRPVSLVAASYISSLLDQRFAALAFNCHNNDGDWSGAGLWLEKFVKKEITSAVEKGKGKVSYDIHKSNIRFESARETPLTFSGTAVIWYDNVCDFKPRQTGTLTKFFAFPTNTNNPGFDFAFLNVLQNTIELFQVTMKRRSHPVKLTSLMTLVSAFLGLRDFVGEEIFKEKIKLQIYLLLPDNMKSIKAPAAENEVPADVKNTCQIASGQKFITVTPRHIEDQAIVLVCPRISVEPPQHPLQVLMDKVAEVVGAHKIERPKAPPSYA